MLARQPQRSDIKYLPCATACGLYVNSLIGLLALKWTVEMIWPRDSHQVSTPF